MTTEYQRGYDAGLRRGLAESKIDAALLDAYQRELAKVYAELGHERGRVTQLRQTAPADRSRSPGRWAVRGINGRFKEACAASTADESGVGP